MSTPSIKPEIFNQFMKELTAFIKDAEKELTLIECDLLGNKHLFEIFTRQMFTIKGTAEQFEMKNVAQLAAVGEELSIKAQGAEKRPQVKKCVGSLWDCLTTIKYLVENKSFEATDEGDLLMTRLEKTLDLFGGAREKVSADDIEALLKNRD